MSSFEIILCFGFVFVSVFIASLRPVLCHWLEYRARTSIMVENLVHFSKFNVVYLKIS